MQKNAIYICPVCGNMVEVLRVGGGELVCCGKPMKQVTANTTDAATEKHVPVIEKIEGGFKVKIGEVEHPMLAEHHIEWIEMIAGDKSQRKYLTVGEAPVAEFLTEAESITARENCNLHGMWENKD